MNRRGRRESSSKKGKHTRTLVAEANHATMESKSRRVASCEAGRRRRDDDGRTTERNCTVYSFLEIVGENAQRGATATAGAMEGRGGNGRRPSAVHSREGRG